MIKELEHTADIAYEIRFKDLKELFCDIILLLRNHTSFVLSEEKVEEEYDWNIIAKRYYEVYEEVAR